MGRILGWLLILAAAAGSVWVGFTFRQEVSVAPDPAPAVPADAVSVLRLEPDWRRTPAALNALGDLLGEEWHEVRSSLGELDSLRLTQPGLQELLNNGPILWSLHRTGDQQTAWMGYLGVRPAQTASVWESADPLLGGMAKTTGRKVRGAELFEVEGLTACLFQNTLLFSPEPALIEAGLARLEAENPAKTAFQQTLDRSGRPAAALLVREGSANAWSSLEFRPKQGRWEWVGMQPQPWNFEPTPLRIPHALIPATAERVEWFAHSAAAHLSQNSPQLADINRLLADLDQVCTCNYKETHFSETPGFGLIRLPEGPVLIMHAPDSLFVQTLSYQHASLNEAYAGVGIFELREPYQASLLTQQPDALWPLTWNQDGYQLFAPDLSTAKQFIRESTSHRTLDLTSTAVNSAEVHSLHLNHLIWEREPTSWNQKNWPLRLPEKPSTELLTLQSAADSLSFVSVKWLHGSQVGTDSLGNTQLAVRWEQELRQPGRGKPWMVRNHYTGARELFVQDEGHQISLFSASGQRLWSATIDGPIQGEVEQVDILRNGKLQLAFNTPTSIYILDRNGNTVDGFPVRLPSKASSPLAVFDYDNNRKYRLVIGTEDGVVRNYTVDGKATAGWQNPGMKSPVVELAHLRIRDKDYLFARESSGNLHLLKRNGKARMVTRARTPGHNRYPSAFVLAETMESSSILYADTSGNVLQVRFDEVTRDNELVGIMEGQRLTRDDITGNRNPDVLLADGRVIKAYDGSLNRLFRTELTGLISHQPQVFRFSSQDRKVGLTIAEHNELYLLHSTGEILDGFPIEGNSAFSIGDMDLDGQFELATFTAYGTLKVYQLP